MSLIISNQSITIRHRSIKNNPRSSRRLYFARMTIPLIITLYFMGICR